MNFGAQSDLAIGLDKADNLNNDHSIDLHYVMPMAKLNHQAGNR